MWWKDMTKLDIPQAFFVWYVADKGYYWDEDAQAGALGSAGQPPFLVDHPATSGLIPYSPLDKPELFLEFAETSPTREGILAFANKYGKLAPAHDVVTPQPGRGDVLLMADSLSLWLGEIWYMKKTAQLWEWLKAEDLKALRKIISWGRDNKSVEYTIVPEGEAPGPRSWGLLASPDKKGEVFARFRAGDVLLPAKYLLQVWINKKLQKYPARPRLLLNEKNELEGYLMPSSLLSALWLQFYFAAIGKSRYKRCSICGLWSDVTNKRATWSKHDECANRDRVARCREKKRKGKEGHRNGNQQGLD